jgi:hypothetical protein
LLRGSDHFAGVNFYHDGLRALRATVDTNVEHNLKAKTKDFERCALQRLGRVRSLGGGVAGYLTAPVRIFQQRLS